jgi:glycosyltransferase involved in cell wall biosynthesis
MYIKNNFFFKKEYLVRFSVVISSYSRKELSLEALDSIFNQSYQKFEILFICHGIKNYINFIKKNLDKKKLKKIKFFYIKNSSLSKARNLGIKKSINKWVAFLDDDDLWMPKKLEIAAKFIKKKKFDVFYSNFSTFFFSSGVLLKKQLVINKTEKIQYLIQLSNYISGGSAAIIDKQSLKDTHYFDETMYGCEDHDFWRRAFNKGKKFYFCNKDLVIYRKNNRNLGQNLKNQILYESYHYRKIKNDLPKNFKSRLTDIETVFLVRLINLHLLNKSFVNFIFTNFKMFHFFTFLKVFKWVVLRSIKLYFFSNNKVSKT